MLGFGVSSVFSLCGGFSLPAPNRNFVKYIFMKWSSGALLPGKWPDIVYWWKVENKPIFLSLFHAQSFAFALVGCLISNSSCSPSYFLSLVLLGSRSERGTWWVWWAPGGQPRSTTTRDKGGSNMCQLKRSHHNQDIRESELKRGHFFFLSLPPPNSPFRNLRKQNLVFFKLPTRQNYFPKHNLFPSHPHTTIPVQNTFSLLAPRLDRINEFLPSPRFSWGIFFIHTFTQVCVKLPCVVRQRWCID